MEKQVISKKRVADHGEVMTGKREVNAMLDLVKNETERIGSRFLEPACGNGNFLAVILERKLEVVVKRYKRIQYEFERNAVLAVSSIYGVDILEDNVKECRQRLLNIFNNIYTNLFKTRIKNKCCEAIRFILEKNIIWGNALDLKTMNEPRRPIIFTEWALITGTKLQRRDFEFIDLEYPDEEDKKSLFSLQQGIVKNDIGGDGFIPLPIKDDYPPISFLEIANVK